MSKQAKVHYCSLEGSMELKLISKLEMRMAVVAASLRGEEMEH